MMYKVNKSLLIIFSKCFKLIYKGNKLHTQRLTLQLFREKGGRHLRANDYLSKHISNHGRFSIILLFELPIIINF